MGIGENPGVLNVFYLLSTVLVLGGRTSLVDSSKVTGELTLGSFILS